MREEARDTELQARQHEAEAARARADAAAAAAAAEDAKARAAEASMDAQRRAGRVDDHRAEAEDLRRQHAEAMRKADDVDPYVDSTRGPSAATPSADARDVVADARHDGHADTRDEVASDEITRPPAPPERRERTERA
jgi:hypothetical protein